MWRLVPARARLWTHGLGAEPQALVQVAPLLALRWARGIADGDPAANPSRRAPSRRPRMTSYGTSAQEFARQFDVPRETLERLTVLHDQTLRWNSSTNLISRSTEPLLWTRHIADSAQLWSLRPKGVRRWADLGAGAGFPGLVIAALAAESEPQLQLTLVESDGRKAVFLSEAARMMGLAVTILDARVETLAPLQADVLSARAFAPLDVLITHAQKHRRPRGMGLFPKGRTVHKEVAAAEAKWWFERRIHPSRTQPGAAIVEVGAVHSVRRTP